MVYELRTYDVKPGLLDDYLRLFNEVGMPVRKNYGTLVGFWSSEFGALNRVVHIWQYESLDHRAVLRAALMKDPIWSGEFLPRALPMLERMESTVLHPTSFSPLQ
ncbi:NIPSNAP family protein [Pendulispora rubella]|uniref:NIPSNAP family protein n=1 Tax=Pendulispora rubella TaxID=2741070 RepID=A0ABZ2KT24_9BACT